MHAQPASLKEYNGEDQVISSTEMALKLKERPNSVIRVKSLISSLDKATDGFQDGELIGVSGPTKSGKSLFCQTLTVNFLKQQYPSLWFSFEMPPRQFLSRFPEPLPLVYLPQRLRAHAMNWLEERIQESFLKFHTRIIFIDHLAYLFDLAKTRNPSIEIGQIIRRLKTIAVNGEFIIFLMCHTTKGASEGNLSFESIRHSSFVSQESDTVFMIKRCPENGENAARLRVEFHRRTGCLERVIEVVKVNGLLEERLQDLNKGKV